MGLIDAASLSDWGVIGRLAVATGLGALIGFEREIDGHDAGMRTHALLALGSAVFGVISVGGFADFIVERATSNVQVDVTRIASYVAAGVGFLGGGAILKQNHRVRGLTTAASLWACAAVGLAAGVGFYSAAIVATVAALMMLLLDAPMRRIRRRHLKRSMSVTFAGIVDPQRMTTTLATWALHKVSVTANDLSQSVVTLEGITEHDVESVLRQLGEQGEVVGTAIW
ncbi:MAG: MgtC/SapB family protein [Ilumatobacteraceae bacterium]